MKLLPLSLFLFVFFSINVYAIAVGSPYLGDNTLKIPEGSTGVYVFTLQNIGEGDEIVTIHVSGKGVELVDEKDEYVIKSGDTNFPLTLNIDPGNAILGDVYEVSYSVKPISAEGTAFPIAVGITKRFKVEIIKDPNKLYLGSYLSENGLIWVVVLITVIGYAWYKRNERKKKKKKVGR